jgi:phosphoserine phosphatase RsbU/P
MIASMTNGAFFASFIFLLLAMLSIGLFLAVGMIRRLRHERDELIHQKDVIFGFIHDVGDVFAYSENVDLDRMLSRVLFYATRTTRAGAGAIYLYDKAEDHFRARAVSGIFPPIKGIPESSLDKVVSKSQAIEQLVRSQRIARGEGLIGEVADFGTSILIEDAERDPRVPQYGGDFLKIRSVLLVPMRFLQRILGVMVVVNRVDAQPFNAADLSLLQALADQASVSIHYAGLRTTIDEKNRIDHDLAVARQIQTALLPRSIPRLPGIELAAFNHPAQEIGGDYYDFVVIDEDHLGIAIADVSGKGIVGAIMMSISRSVLRAQAVTSLSPAAVLKGVNRIMFEDIAEDMFVSMLYMVLNTRTRTLSVARAGHERPAWCQAQAADQPFTIIDSRGLALGISDQETFDATLTETRVTLQPGDIVVAYTDGVTEAMDTAGEEWGVDRLLEAVHTAAPDGANAVLNSVQQRLMRFVGGVEQYDDMTLLALRILA